MTKARDTANLVATGVPNSLITLDAAEIPNISTDKLTTGTLANARVGNYSKFYEDSPRMFWIYDYNKSRDDLNLLLKTIGIIRIVALMPRSDRAFSVILATA